MTTKVWHYSVDGERFGPVIPDELRRLAAKGDLGPTDLVWKQGMTDWIPASRIKGLFAKPAATPSPVPPSPPKGEGMPSSPSAVMNGLEKGIHSRRWNAAKLFQYVVRTWQKLGTRAKVAVAGGGLLLTFLLCGGLVFVDSWLMGGSSATHAAKSGPEADDKRGGSTRFTVDEFLAMLGKKANGGDPLIAANYDRDTFIHTFGEPDSDTATGQGRRAWTHKCSDGKVILSVEPGGGRLALFGFDTWRDNTKSKGLTRKKFMQTIEMNKSYQCDEFFQTRGYPNADIDKKDPPGSRTWIYTCSDGEVSLDVRLTFFRQSNWQSKYGRVVVTDLSQY
jgi:hypothetical protein